MNFEWNDAKNKENLRKHDVDFDEASKVFSDPWSISGYDAEHSAEEERFYLIGFSSRRLLYVIFIEKIDENLSRIISARKAEAKHRKEYVEKNKS